MENLQDAKYANTPRYSTTTGLLTDYGRALGLKENTGVNSEMLASTNKTNLPKATAPDYTNLTGLINGTVAQGKIDSKADQDMQRFIQERQAENEKVLSLMSDVGQEAGLTQKFAEQEGAFEAKKAYDDYISQIEAESLALRRETDKIRENMQGATSFGIESRAAEIERKSLSKQADLAILQNAAARRYSTAMDIAKAKVEMQLAPKKAQLEGLKYVIENNKAFQTAEFNSILNRKQKEVETEEENRLKGEEMIINALQYQAPSSLISKARDVIAKGGSLIEVANTLGKYSGDYLANEIKRASLAKTNAEINKIQNEIKASNAVIDTSTLPNTTKGFAAKLMASAKNDKQLDATERTQMSKMTSVIGQLDSLQSNLSKNNMTGIIKGKVNKLLGDLNLNKDITTINAQIQALIPNVARGIYGEVGVLTDADIENYKKTVANLKNSQDQNDAVLALTLKNAMKSYENTLNTAVNSGIDVSGWTQDYLKIQNKVNEIEDRIGVSKEAVNNIIAKDPSMSNAIKEMYTQGFTDGEILEALNAR